MIRVGILGATGYTALELIKLLLRHADVEIALLTSRQSDHPNISAIHPSLVNRLNLQLEDFDAEAIAARCECVFSCLPHAASAEVVGRLQGVFTVVVGGGPRLADTLHGAAAAVVGTTAAAAGGGALVVLGVLIAALLAPVFMRYRAPIEISDDPVSRTET